MNRPTIKLVVLSAGALALACTSVPKQDGQPQPKLSDTTAVQGNPVIRTETSPVEPKQRAYQGFEFTARIYRTNDGKTTFSHPTITEVAPGSPADRAGLQVGDVILEVNGKDSRQGGTLVAEVGVKMVFRVRRGEAEKEMILVPMLAKKPG